MKREVEARVIESISDIHVCVFCKSEQIKWGYATTSVAIFRDFHANHAKSFTVNLGFERMKHDPQSITTARADGFLQAHLVQRYADTRVEAKAA